MRNYCFMAILTAILYISPVQAAMAFTDSFEGTSLDPAWQVVEYNGTLPRAQGQTSPANHYQMVDGKLRYVVDPMTYSMGFVNNYQRTSPYYDYDPGLELQRSFDGDQWVFESKSSYHMTGSNGRGLGISVVFGNGQTGSTTYAAFSRSGEGSRYQFSLLSFEPTLATGTNLMEVMNYVSTSDDTRYFRLDRSGGVLTAMWGTDGVTWQTVGSYDFGNSLDGLQQRVILSGEAWFNPGGSYADYDYISVVPEPATISLLSLGGLAFLRRRK